MSRRKVCVVVGSRANYASIRSVMRAVADHPALELQLVATASALLERYGAVVEVMRADGFEPDAEVHMLIEGETPLTMAKSTGLGLLELPAVFGRLAPDVVLTVGDRFETMATALAATYMNLPLAHTMGGEVSGNIDDSIRHAITKFAHLHFPSSADAADRIRRLGEEPDRIFMTGCPRIDLVAELVAGHGLGQLRAMMVEDGVGPAVSLEEPYLVVSQHPVTTEYGEGERQIEETLAALVDLSMPTVMLWPNSDAGADDVARGIRKFRERHPSFPMHLFKNLPPELYLPLMGGAACVIGNSSSAIREGAYLGTPAVDVGSRQTGRERGPNVVHAGYHRQEIAAAVRRQLAHGPYRSEVIYGDGKAGVRIAEVLADVEFRLSKSHP